MVDTREERVRKGGELLASVLSAPLSWYVTALASRRGGEREGLKRKGG